MIGFIITAAVGFVLLLISLVFDGILDSIDMDFSGSGIFSGASLGGLLTGLGCGGVIGTAQGWGFLPSLVLGVIIGLIMSGVAIVLYRVLNKAETPPEEFSLATMIGTAGVASAAAIEPGSKGLVQVMYLGSPRTVSFLSPVPIASGESVTVTDILGPDTVKVLPSQPQYGRDFL